MKTVIQFFRNFSTKPEQLPIAANTIQKYTPPIPLQNYSKTDFAAMYEKIKKLATCAHLSEIPLADRAIYNKNQAGQPLDLRLDTYNTSHQDDIAMLEMTFDTSKSIKPYAQAAIMADRMGGEEIGIKFKNLSSVAGYASIFFPLSLFVKCEPKKSLPAKTSSNALMLLPRRDIMLYKETGNNLGNQR